MTGSESPASIRLAGAEPPSAVGLLAAGVTAYSLLSYAILLLGWAGLIGPWSLMLAVLASLGAFFALARRSLVALRRDDYKLLGLALLLAVPFLHALWLPAFKEDDLMYHLWVPRQMARTGSLVLDPYSMGAQLPLLYELPLTVLELPGVRLSPFLISFATLAALAAAVMALMRDVMKQPLWLAALVAATVLATPVVFDMSHAAYVEMFFALQLLLTLALYREGRWYEACLMAGLSAGTKYYGLILIAMLIAVERLRGLRTVPVVWTGLLLAALAGAPFYLKSWLVTGNPLFPFGQALLENDFVSHERLGLGHAMAAVQDGGRRDPLLLVQRVFGFQPLTEGTAAAMSGQLSLFYLLALLAWRRREPWVLVALASGGLFFAAWVMATPNPRYLFPFVLPLALIGASALPRAMAVVAAVLAMGQSAHNVAHQGNDEGIWAVLRGEMSREEFLTRRYRGSFGLAQAANERVDPSASRIMLIGMFGRAYYYEAPTLSSVYFDTEPLLGHTPEKFWAFVRKEGLTHIAVNWAFVTAFHAQDDRLDVPGFQAFLAANGEVLFDSPPYQLVRLHPPSIHPAKE